MATLINREKNLVYMHFSKTGGWLLYTILKDHGFEIVDMNICGGHMGQIHFGPEYETFGFIRHPVDWHISMFNFLNGLDWVIDQPDHRADFTWAKRDTLDDFITDIRRGPLNSFNLSHRYFLFFGLNFGHSPCKRIGKYEDMFRYLDMTLKEFDINITEWIEIRKQSRLNSSVRKDTYISQENLNFIYYSCDPIFNRFNYEKENKYDNPTDY